MEATNTKPVVRVTQAKDVEGIVSLFCETGTNPYNWSVEKWTHYYEDYPDGQPISLVAVINDQVVGHYGMLPVRIGQLSAMLGLHAYVARQQRGLTVISALMKEVDRRCQALGVALICGFANPKFSFVKSTIFKWQIPCWLGFQRGLSSVDIEAGRNKKFSFQYTPKWYEWRFGEKRDQYISKYVDGNGIIHRQLLKVSAETALIQGEEIEAWTPNSTYQTNQQDQFCQPFSIKVFDQRLISEDVLNHANWSIEMGDSDTFQYTLWKDDK
jgi:GNAT superfamily N-acetyltransferase